MISNIQKTEKTEGWGRGKHDEHKGDVVVVLVKLGSPRSQCDCAPL